MNNLLFRKGLVMGIIFLFAGVSVIPSVLGHEEDVEKTEYTLNENIEVKNINKNKLVTRPIKNEISLNNGWFEQFKFIPLDGSADDNFGCSVSVNGNYAVIGAHRNENNGDTTGSAYVFKRSGSTWIQDAKLLALDIDDDRFGSSVSIDGDYVVIGAPYDRDFGSKSGSAYVFKHDGNSWTQQAKLLPSDGEQYMEFGHCVSIYGDYILIGADYDNYNAEGSGAAYVFKRNNQNWIQQAKLLAQDGVNKDCFGKSVSIAGDYAVIGAYYDDDNGENSGSAYVFKRSESNWTQDAKLLPHDGDKGDLFGFSASIEGDYILIGVYGDDDNGNYSG